MKECIVITICFHKPFNTAIGISEKLSISPARFLVGIFFTLDMIYIEFSPETFIVFFTEYSLVYILALSPFIAGFYSIPINGIPAGIYVGCFEMGFAFLFWLKALSLTKSTDKLGNIIYLVPFLSLMFIHFVLGESLYWTTFAGLSLIVVSVVFQQVVDKKTQRL